LNRWGGARSWGCVMQSCVNASRGSRGLPPFRRCGQSQGPEGSSRGLARTSAMTSLRHRFAKRGRRSYPCGAPLRRRAVRNAAPRKAQEKNWRKEERKAGRRKSVHPFPSVSPPPRLIVSSSPRFPGSSLRGCSDAGKVTASSLGAARLRLPASPFPRFIVSPSPRRQLVGWRRPTMRAPPSGLPNPPTSPLTRVPWRSFRPIRSRR
jgi:hypothetical protein